MKFFIVGTLEATRIWQSGLAAWVIFSLALLYLAAHINGNTPSALPPEVVVLDSLTVRTADQSLPTRLAMLPGQHIRTPRTFKEFHGETAFEIPDVASHKLWALYITSFAHGGQISINGNQIGQVASSTPETTVWHTRPFLFTVPNGILKNGSNDIEIQWGGRESLTLLSMMAVGPLPALEPLYRSRLFLQNTMAEIALVHAMVISAVLLSIYGMRKHQASYLTLGIGALGFSIIMLTYMLPPMPSWFYPFWRAIHISGIGLFTVGAWLFLIREAQPANRWFPILCISWGVCGPFAYLLYFSVTDISFFKWFETAWGTISGILGIYPVGLMVASVWRRWNWRKFIFILASMCAIGMGIADVLLQGTGRSALGGAGYGLQTVSPLWFTALTVVLVMDFAKSLLREDEQRIRLANELKKQEKALASMHAVAQSHERKQAAMLERERIMQDIHDGLGSQLISSLAISERGDLNSEQTSLLLRACIDDLRLAIDAFSSDEDNFSAAATNLRFRMAPRLAAAGITLHWDDKEWTSDAVVPTVNILPLLRIMQEVITNTVKHGQAEHLYVTLKSSTHQAQIILEDDGWGFDPSVTSTGKGLKNMKKRVLAMKGASIRVTSNPDMNANVPKGRGTRVEVIISDNP